MSKYTLQNIGLIIALIFLIFVGCFAYKEAGLTIVKETRNELNLKVVDKKIDTNYMYTGKVVIPSKEYFLTVDYNGQNISLPVDTFTYGNTNIGDFVKCVETIQVRENGETIVNLD